MLLLHLSLKNQVIFTADPNGSANGSVNYIRFSTKSYSEIATSINLEASSNELISAMFSTALLNAVGTDLLGQQLVKCYTVAK